jgi:predicted small secreted protein
MSKFDRSRKALVALVMLAAASAVSACNTVEGAGEDIQKAGRGIENSANRNK